MGKTYMTAEALCNAARAMVGKFSYAQVDCIRVITNPMTAAGAKYPYIGSNYLARYGVTNLQHLTSTSQLGAGKALFRSREPTENGYALPDRYKSGGNCFTGSLLDFHHVGLDVGDGQIVDSNRGGGQDGPALSSNWKAWEWIADIDGVDYISEGGTPTMQTCYVVANIGTVNMRQGPGASYKLALKNPRIPEGATVEVISEENSWTKVQYNGETGYVSSQYIVTDAGTTTPQSDEDRVTLPLSRAAAKELYESLKVFFDA